jgi:hypothetical protein
LPVFHNLHLKAFFSKYLLAIDDTESKEKALTGINLMKLRRLNRNDDKNHELFLD